MKFMSKIIKRIVFSFTIMYSFNILVAMFNMNVPVNLYSLGIVSILGVPGMISLMIIKFIIK